MKNLFEAARVDEVKTRIAVLRPDSERQWGIMNAAQAVEHCSRGFELALGERLPQRLLIGRIIGGLVKPKVMENDEPLRRNSPRSCAAGAGLVLRSHAAPPARAADAARARGRLLPA